MTSYSKQHIEIDTVLCSRWLSLQAKLLQSAVRGCIYIQQINGATPQPRPEVIQWPANLDDTDHFHQVCKRVEKEQKGVILSFQEARSDKAESSNSVHIALPLSLDSDTLLISAFELRPQDKQQLHQSMQQLEWGLMWLKEDLTTAPATETVDKNDIYELPKLIQEQSNLEEAATLLANRLASLFNCLRVSVGQFSNEQISILAISHQPTLDKTSLLVADIIRAMQECIDQDSRVIYPDLAKQIGPITHHHQKLSKKHGSTTIISYPIASAYKEERFIVVLEKEAPKRPNTHKLQLFENITNTIGPILNSISLNQQSLVTLTRRRIKHKLQSLSHNKKATLIKTGAPLLILLYIFFGKGDFRIESDVSLSGTILRTIVAPFPGYVAKANKSAGDHVEEGETLAFLDTSDLTLDELSWRSKYTQADLEYRKAIAENATSQAKIIRQQKKQAEIQLSLLQLQKGRAEIKAPFTGTIVTGDLSQSIGGPVERGKLLFEMVPDGGFKILAQVDEKDISFIDIGQSGVLVFNSLPKDTFNFTVSKITPIATAMDGANSFRVEARLGETTKRLSPGMTGYGKITVGSKPYIWLWTRTLRNKIRLLGWKLMP